MSAKHDERRDGERSPRADQTWKAMLAKVDHHERSEHPARYRSSKGGPRSSCALDHESRDSDSEADAPQEVHQMTAAVPCEEPDRSGGGSGSHQEMTDHDGLAKRVRAAPR